MVRYDDERMYRQVFSLGKDDIQNIFQDILDMGYDCNVSPITDNNLHVSFHLYKNLSEYPDRNEKANKDIDKIMADVDLLDEIKDRLSDFNLEIKGPKIGSIPKDTIFFTITQTQEHPWVKWQSKNREEKEREKARKKLKRKEMKVEESVVNDLEKVKSEFLEMLNNPKYKRHWMQSKKLTYAMYEAFCRLYGYKFTGHPEHPRFYQNGKEIPLLPTDLKSKLSPHKVITKWPEFWNKRPELFTPKTLSTWYKEWRELELTRSEWKGKNYYNDLRRVTVPYETSEDDDLKKYHSRK